MKTYFSHQLPLILTGIILFNFASAQSFKVNSNESKLEWFAEKVTGKHNGTVDIKEGEFNVKNNQLHDGYTILDMTSINTTDLEGQWKTKLDNHLKSEDFFNVENHSTAKLTIKEAKKNNDNTYQIKADLEIKGIKNPIEFPAEISISEGKMQGIADITVDRTKWDIKYKSGSFFDDLGDKVIYDDIKFKVSIQASKD